MYSRKFSRSITRSPGSRPSPSFTITSRARLRQPAQAQR
jgi:hypothetical protein